MNREKFLDKLEEEFPDAYSTIDEYEKGALHCEMGAFRVYIEKKMIDGGEWYCEKAFRFIEKCLAESDSDLKNAIEVSFIEDLALGDQNDITYKIVKERAPKIIREKMRDIHEFWS